MCFREAIDHILDILRLHARRLLKDNGAKMEADSCSRTPTISPNFPIDEGVCQQIGLARAGGRKGKLAIFLDL